MLPGITEYCEGDIGSVAFEREYMLFSRHIEFHSCESSEDVLQMLYQKSLDHAYPNVTKVYRLYLTLPVTSAQ